MKYFLSAAVWGVILVTGTQARKQKTLGKAVSDVLATSLPTCEECTPKEVIEEPGIGLDLNIGYTTAAIKYYNGTVVDVAHINPSPAYMEMMNKFSPPWVRYGPPFDTTRDRIAYNLDQTKRRWRRFRGLPSTEEIELLSTILEGMKETTSLALGSPVFKVLPTTPWLPNLHREDFEEAFELAGLQLLHTYSYFDIFQQSNAAWAGMGNGLCKHWRDYYQCQDEEDEMDFKNVLSVSFTAEELSIENLGVWDVHRVAKLRSEQYSDLGYSAWERNQGNATFWDLVGDKILAIAKVGEKYGEKLSDLIVMGEFGENKKFLDTLWKAVGSVGRNNIQELWRPLQTEGFSAEFVAARGAAEIARREQNRVWDCVDPDWCQSGKGDRKSDEELKRV